MKATNVDLYSKELSKKVSFPYEKALTLLNRKDNNGRWVIADGSKWEYKDNDINLKKAKQSKQSKQDEESD